MAATDDDATGGAKARRRGGSGAYAALALAPLLWSGNVVVGRALREAVDPVALNLYRWCIAGVLVLPLAARPLWRHRRQIRDAWGVIVGLGVTGLAGFQTCVYYAVRDTPALNALLILQAAPVVILLGAVVFYGERMSPRRALGVVLAATGALVLITRGAPATVLSLQLNRGDLWMLLAVALWAAYSLLLERCPRALPQTALLAATIVVGLALLVPAWWLTGGPAARPPLSPEALAGALYVGVFASFVAFLCWNTGVARVGPGTAGSFMYLMPLYGAVLGYAALGEGIAPFHLAGAALVFAGLALLRSAARRDRAGAR